VDDMNERIQELSKIAYTNHLERNPHSSFGRRYDYDKEFAELIVNQCADIAQQHNKSPVAAPLAIGYVIREHFGVAE
jgi:hypothetical protein